MALGSGSSKKLIGRQFGHSLAEDSTPLGILVGMRRRATTSDPGGYIEDASVRLSIDGEGVIGSNLAQPGHWPAGFATAWYGGSNDLWGIEGFTAIDVNSPDFQVRLTVFGQPAGESKGSHTVDAEVAEITTRVYYTEAEDPNRVCFATRSVEPRSNGIHRQHPTEDVWGRLIEEGALPYAPPAGLEQRTTRGIILPSQGDFSAIGDEGSNAGRVQVLWQSGYLFAREAAL